MAGSYKRIYLAAGSTIIGLFIILTMIGLQIHSDGDKICSGTLEDPCLSYITIYNPTAKNIYIYNEEQVKFDFSPEIRDYVFFTKDGRCGATGSCVCVLKDGSTFGMKGWRCTDFTDATKPTASAKYVFLWSRYSVREHLLVGFKNNPAETIKWSLGAPGDVLDPTWAGITETNITLDSVQTDRKYEYGTFANITVAIVGNLSKIVCINFNAPDYNNSYDVCGTPPWNHTANISYVIGYHRQETFDGSDEFGCVICKSHWGNITF